MNKILTIQTRIHRWGIVILSLVVAIGFHFLLYPQLGGLSNVFFSVPIIAAAWYFGWRGAGLVIVTGLLCNISAEFVYHGGKWNAFPWVTNLVSTLVAIWISFSTIRMKRVLDERSRELIEFKEIEKKNLLHAKFLTLLNEILHAALEAGDLKALLDILANRTGELFSADDCFITLWDETNKVAKPSAAYGSMRETYSEVIPRPGERTLTSSVLETGRSLVVDDTTSSPFVDEDVAIPFPKLKSALGLPLISGKKKLGGLIVGYHQKHDFTAEEIEQGELAARQISLAIMKAILLEETRKNLSELAGLHAIAQTFTLQDDPPRTFGLLTEIVTGLFNTEMCMVALYDAVLKEVHGQPYAAGIPDEQVEAFRYQDPGGRSIWNFSKTPIFQAASLEQIPTEIRAFAAQAGIKNLLAAPLRNAEQMQLGILLVANKTGGFGKDETRLLEVLANQASVVVENTRLLTNERRRAKELSLLNKLSAAASDARNEDSLIEQVTQLIGEQLYPDNFGVMLLDEKKQDLYLHSSYKKGTREKITRIPLGSGITGWVAACGKARRVDDIRNEADYIKADESVLSELCVPLKIGDRVIGVLNAENARTGAFTSDDESLLEIIAGQLIGAIQRLRASEAEYHQTAMLLRANALIRVLAQVGARAAAAPDPAGVMKTLGDGLAKIGMNCLVALPQDEKTLNIAYSSIPKKILDLLERASKHRIAQFSLPFDGILQADARDDTPRLLEDPRTIVDKMLVGFSSNAVEKIMKLTGMTDQIPVCQLPLISEGKMQGILWMWGEGIKENDLPTLSIFANQVAIALQNSRLLTEVQRLAIMDHGTGIFNRRHFFELAEQEFSQARRYEHALTAIIVDVDNFKAFNDNYGHIIGDQVLYLVAQTLKDNLREGDILGRYGGEEFSILLPFTNLATARHVAQRLCERVAGAKAQAGTQQLAVTVSIGMAEIQPEMKTLLTLVEQADQAMYTAKESGGNQVDSR